MTLSVVFVDYYTMVYARCRSAARLTEERQQVYCLTYRCALWVWRRRRAVFAVPSSGTVREDDGRDGAHSRVANCVCSGAERFFLWALARILILSGAAAQLRYIQDGTPAHGLLCGGD